MSTDWKTVIGAVAPTLATALGGPLAGLAASIAGNILLGKDVATPDEVIEAVMANQSPETLLKLKEIESDLLLKMEELSIKRDQIVADDRADARNREIQTKDPMVVRFAIFIFTGFFGILSAFIAAAFMGVTFSPEVLSPVNIMLGSLTTLIVQVGAYYFGSSLGSSMKSITIDKILGK